MSNFTKMKLCHNIGISQSTHLWMTGIFTFLLLFIPGSKAKADDVPSTWKSVSFNDGIRYSQWVINSRISDFYGNDTKRGFNTYDANGNKIGGSLGTQKFDYVPGLVAKAILEAYANYSTFDWSKPWFYSVMNYAKDNTYTLIAKEGATDFSKITLDNMNACKIYFPLMAADALSTDAKSKGETAIANVLTDMKKYNSMYVIGGSKSGVASSTNETVKSMFGGWFHKPAYTDQMWCDGLYMGAALLAQIINYKNNVHNITVSTDKSDDWDLIAKQFTISWNNLYNSSKGLLYHAFTANPKDNASTAWTGISNTTGSEVYHSEAFWGRAMGWYFLALVDVLEQMPSYNKNRETLKGYLQNLASGLARYQDAETGCWYQVIDEKDNPLTGNYLESSCTSLFAAAYLKAVRLGLLTNTGEFNYKTIGENAFKGAVNQFMKCDSYNPGEATTVQLVHNCASAGLGGTAKRSGSRDYYINGSDVGQTNTYTEGKVMGAFIMAATEYEKANPKSIRLSSDLAPSYSLTKGESIKVEASGEGSASYQWYDASGAITGAESYSYAPTTTGKYYCKITVTPKSTSAKTRAASDGTYEITTRATDVTVSEAVASSEIFSLTITYNQVYSLASGSDLNLTPEYATVTGGTALVHNGHKTDAAEIIYLKNGSGNIALNGSGGTYTKLSLKTPLQEGDVITFTSDEKSIGSFYLTTSGTKDEKCSVTKGTYTITSTDGLAGAKDLYIWNNSSGKFKSITITRSGSSTEPSKSNDASATFTYNGSALTFTEDVATIHLESTQAEKTITISVAPATGANITTTSENTSITGNVISITAPAAGSSASYTYTVTAEDGTTTKKYTINVNVEVVTAVYQYKVKSGDKTPGVNGVKYITTVSDGTGDKLVKMTFGGWKWGTNPEKNNHSYKVPNKTDLQTDSWSAADTEGVNKLDGYDFWFNGGKDAVDESKASSKDEDGKEVTIYGDVRYGWFKSKTTDSEGKVTTYPFTLPVRGAYMTFEPTKNGWLTIYILQNGVWNTYDKATTVDNIEYAKGDIKPGEFRMHSFFITNQRGLTVQDFAPGMYSYDVNQKVQSGYSCSIYERDKKPAESEMNIHGKDVSYWPEFWTLDDDEREAVYTHWKDGDNGSETVIELSNGSFLLIQKAVIKYRFHVTGNETYYFFSNFSKMGFSGATFVPDEAQPTASLTLSETAKYTAPTAGKDAVVPNVTIPQYNDITLTRTFTADQWTTLTLPFNLTQEEVQKIFGAGTQIIMLNNATLINEGARLEFIYHEIQNVLPGYPYLIKPTLVPVDATNDANVKVNGDNSAITSFTVYGKCINPSISPFKVDTTPYTFMGTPGYCTANEYKTGSTTPYSVNYKANDIFVSEGDGKLYVSGGTSYGKGYRAWLQNKAGTTAVKSISVVMSSFSDDDNTTTAIDVAEIAPDLLEALGIQTGVYNLSGQRVANDTHNLKAGIYIVNGKKTVVR